MRHLCVRFISGTVFLGMQLLLSQPVESAAPLDPPCEPAEETRKLLDALPHVREMTLPYEARIGVRRRLAERYPDDFFIQLAYQDSFRRSFNLHAEYERALAMYRQRPRHPLSRYLEARLLMMARPSQSKAVFEELLASQPGFAWPHLDFIEYLNIPGHRDPAQYERRMKSFLQRCPDSVEACRFPPLTEDAAFRRSLIENLRRVLELRNSPRDAQYWARLWNFERDLPDIADRVRADWKRIEAWPFAVSIEWTALYMTASNLLKDPSIIQQYERRLAEQAPRSYALQQLLQSNWHRDNPFPGNNPSKEQITAYEAKRKEMLRSLANRWPGDCALHLQDRSSFAMRQHEENFQLTPGELAGMDLAIRCQESAPDAVFSMPPLETMIAETYVAAKTRLDQVPGLLKAGFQAFEAQERYRISNELLPLDAIEKMREFDKGEFISNRTRQIQTDYFLATGRVDEARELVEEALRKIDTAVAARTQTRPGSANPGAGQRSKFERNMWVRRMAELRLKENKIDEALDLFRTTIGTVNKEALTSQTNPWVGRVRRLYVEKHGSEEGWIEWASQGRPAESTIPAPQPVAFYQPLPDFTAKDLAGRDWSLRELQGKATLVNYWATWCGPCRAEHPQLQKLHDLVKDRMDIQILTVSVDDSPATASSYIKENKYSFPVLHGAALADKLLPWAILPSNFLVNSSGVRSGLYGYWGGDTWLERVIADLEKASK